MKLQNFMVLFVIIVLPVILVTSYYMSLQIDTINMQTSYNEKLLESTKSAIEAYEINTVEWNSDYASTSDSKRRDIMASINTFTSSFANNLGVGGANKESILSYVPAIAYTLYDGYYIYSPAQVKETIKDENEVTVTMDKTLKISNKIATYKEEDNGKVLYLYDTQKGGSPDGTYLGEGICNGKAYTLNPQLAKTDYKHVLKPFSTYSKTYTTGDGHNIKVIVNYTLDNYVKIYGKTETDAEYGIKQGYLTNNVILDSTSSRSIKNIKYKGNKKIVDIKPEQLTENIGYYLNDKTSTTYGNICYVYDSENRKVYIDDDGNAFTLDSSGKKIAITNELNRYKKCTIPCIDGSSLTYIEIYQDLSSGIWFKKKENIEKIEDNLEELELSTVIQYLDLDSTILDLVDPDLIKEEIKEETIKKDYSAINWCVESEIFTNWAKSLKIKADGKFLFENIDDEDSIFNIERRNVIRQTLESSLKQAITSYSRNSANGYTIPKLSETDWDQILTNVSIITFVQNIPIGMKYFNNYAIATSTQNKEYVDPNEIYLQADGDDYYHKPYCNKLENNNNNIVGYRNIDYVLKSYEEDYMDGELKKTKNIYYYRHSKSGTAEQSCYYCLIQRELYEGVETEITKLKNEETAYCIALARERYVAKKMNIPLTAGIVE